MSLACCIPAKTHYPSVVASLYVSYSGADGTGSSDLLDEVGEQSPEATDLRGMQGIEDTSILEDVAEAEEEYDRPEQVSCVHNSCVSCSEKESCCHVVVLVHCRRVLPWLYCVSRIWPLTCENLFEQAFNEAGIAFEPFHLKREREEGFFDSDGNYIQYKLDEVKDAWLDSLADGIFLALLECFMLAAAQQHMLRLYMCIAITGPIPMLPAGANSLPVPGIAI